MLTKAQFTAEQWRYLCRLCQCCDYPTVRINEEHKSFVHVSGEPMATQMASIEAPLIEMRIPTNATSSAHISFKLSIHFFQESSDEMPNPFARREDDGRPRPMPWPAPPEPLPRSRTVEMQLDSLAPGVSASINMETSTQVTPPVVTQSAQCANPMTPIPAPPLYDPTSQVPPPPPIPAPPSPPPVPMANYGDSSTTVLKETMYDELVRGEGDAATPLGQWIRVLTIANRALFQLTNDTATMYAYYDCLNSQVDSTNMYRLLSESYLRQMVIANQMLLFRQREFNSTKSLNSLPEH